MRKKGDTGENLIGLLESRLDTFVYRAAFAPTVFASRQFVSHKHVKVNGKVVNIPSYRLNPDDVVEVKGKSQTLMVVLNLKEKIDRATPGYISVESCRFRAVFLKRPLLKEVPFAVKIE